MAFTFKVKTVFNAVGNMGKFFKQSAAGAKKFGNDASRAFRKASRAGKGFRSVLKGVLGANLITGGLRFLAQGLREVTTQFISFDDAIISAAAKMDGLNFTTKDGQKQLQELRDVARQIGGFTEFTPTRAAEGLGFLAQAGFDAKQSIALIPGLVDLATASNLDLARASDIASDAIDIFGLRVDDTGQLIKNFQRLSDGMVTVINATNTNLEFLFETIKGGGKIFTDAGQSLETFLALAGLLAAAGIKAEKSGVALRNAMLNLVDPKTLKVLQNDYGIAIANVNGGFKDMSTIIGDIAKKIGTLPPVERLGVLSELFKKRGVSSVSTIIDPRNFEFLDTIMDKLENAGFVTQRVADIMRTSLGNQLKQLASAALELGFKFLEAFAGKGSKAIKQFTAFLRDFDVKPTLEVLKNLVTIAGNLFDALKPIGVVLKVAVIPALIIITDVMAEHPSLVSMAITAWAGYAVTLWAVNSAQLALIASNPITWIVLGIAAVVAGIVWLVKNWDFAIDKVKEFGSYLVNDLPAILLRFVAFVTRVLHFGLDNPISSFFDSVAGDLESANGEVTTNVTGQQSVQLNGQINVSGLPEGSTGSVADSTGQSVDLAFAGVNP